MGKFIAGTKKHAGFTIIEVMISLVILSVLVLATVQLYVTMVNTTTFMKRRAIALDYSTNRVEHLRSLPYDSLSIGQTTTTITRDGYPYVVKTTINYVDDFNETKGCIDYGSDANMAALCRGWTKAKDSPAKRTDDNPMDYKSVLVEVRGRENVFLNSTNTLIASRVAETASGTGAIVVRVIDGSGNPVSGASVSCENATVSPAQTVANCSKTTDGSGLVVFYGLPPDASPDYVLRASKTGYSSIWTIPATNKFQPVYPNVSLVAQKTSMVTLRIMPKSDKGLLIETVDPSGAHVPYVRVAIKGGYKKYINPESSDYYYQYGMHSARPVTDANGYVSVNITDDPTSPGGGLAPGEYFFCDDYQNNACKGASGSGASHVLVAALPYYGNAPFNPVLIPQYIEGVSPAPQYYYGGVAHIQKVRLVLSTNNSLPTLISMGGSSIKLSAMTAAELAAVPFTLKGEKLNALGTVTFTQRKPAPNPDDPPITSTYSASCSGSNTQKNCVADLTGIGSGIAALEFDSGGSKVLKFLPSPPDEPEPLGGFIISE